jgi:hypothetical protein
MLPSVMYWFKTTPEKDKYLLVGISHEEVEGPGVILTVQCERYDYGEPAVQYPETQQLALFQHQPEMVISCEQVVVPSLFYARARPDWMEGKWNPAVASGVDMDPCDVSTPTSGV